MTGSACTTGGAMTWITNAASISLGSVVLGRSGPAAHEILVARHADRVLAETVGHIRVSLDDRAVLAVMLGHRVLLNVDVLRNIHGRVELTESCDGRRKRSRKGPPEQLLNTHASLNHRQALRDLVAGADSRHVASDRGQVFPSNLTVVDVRGAVFDGDDSTRDSHGKHSTSTGRGWVPQLKKMA
eukprot:CAMPEP_0176039726 /NCGR_PEP_ID=MMETSP0120_2-20121206/19694_1 /TAXON_ID=160619 /ORGANISM="Kryptoperidinium foliaceum, Strain CCMP 1326" /LENGTH=184 /DNA_ID=CAMNT_0017373121 /DNA_START=514 /DNA_END=1068 /DNA_ORIENTATION=-